MNIQSLFFDALANVDLLSAVSISLYVLAKYNLHPETWRKTPKKSANVNS